MNKKAVKFLGLAVGGFISYKLYQKLNENKSENQVEFNPPTTEELNDSDNNEWTHGYIKANGINFHYVSQGEGPLLLLLHGFPENWYSWKKQIPFLAEKYKVVAIDMRGYNYTEKPQNIEDYRLDILRNDIKTLIKAFGEEKAVIVGHDWGGVVAWSFAMIYPEMVEKLVIMNAPHPVGYIKALKSSMQLLNSWYVLFFQLPDLPEKMMEKDHYQFMINSLKESSQKPEQAFAEDDIEHFIDCLRQPGTVSAMINYYRALVRYSSENRVKRIDLPTLMVWGEKDKFLRKEVNNGIDKYVTDLTIKYIPEASHWVNRDEPEKVNKMLADFLF